MTKIALRKIVTSLIGSIIPLAMFAGQDNVAPQAKVSVSDILGIGFEARNLVDGKVMYANEGEWACKGSVTSWGVMHLPWAQLDWDNEIDVDRIVLYDRVSELEYLAGGTLHFSDGSKVSVTAIPNDGSPKEVCFPSKKIKWVRFEATDGAGKNIGLSEIEVFRTRGENTEYVEWVDPYIETTRGRWFYCTPAARPFGMVAAHAFTRNKNQGGGGYNYNFNEVLGFSQVNEWMVSGPNIMPVSGGVNPTQGMDGWMEIGIQA